MIDCKLDRAPATAVGQIAIEAMEGHERLPDQVFGNFRRYGWHFERAGVGCAATAAECRTVDAFCCDPRPKLR
jgi:hypothetical protein